MSKTKMIAVLCLLVSAVVLLASDELIPNSTSPDGKYGVVRKRNAEGEVSFAISRMDTQRAVASFTPPFDEELTINDVATAWRQDSKLLAALVSYGTKMSGVAVFKMTDGKFVGHLVPTPSPEKTFKENTKSQFYGNDYVGDRFTVIILGGWKSDSINILIGDAKEEAVKGMLYAYVSFSARLVGDEIKVNNVKYRGVVEEKDNSSFVDKWRKDTSK